MKLALVVAALLSIALVGTACSGSSDALTLEEYFAEFEAVDMEVDQRIDALYVNFPEGTDEEIFSNDENVQFFKDLVAGFQAIVGDGIDRMKALDPPSEVKAEHDALIAAGEASVAAFAAGGDVIQDAQTMAEFDAIFPPIESDIDATEAAFEAACLDLVAVADANDVTVNVDCLDDE